LKIPITERIRFAGIFQYEQIRALDRCAWRAAREKSGSEWHRKFGWEFLLLVKFLQLGF